MMNDIFILSGLVIAAILYKYCGSKFYPICFIMGGIFGMLLLCNATKEKNIIDKKNEDTKQKCSLCEV